ncbi:MAG: hypothetical protein WCT41_02725 [Candidatus Paceibacterota bacterium]
MTLNAGRLLQQRTWGYLNGLVTGAEPAPDVLCLQDIPERDLPWLRRQWRHVAFAAMTNHLINGHRAVVGIAILSRYPMIYITRHTTWGNGKLKDLQGVNDKNERFPPTKETDDLIDTTEDRRAICVTVIKDNRKYNIATTHGYWVRGGATSDRQRESTRKLLEFLTREGNARDGLFLAADMNFGRGGEMYQMVTAGRHIAVGFSDKMPANIDNTLDPDHPFVKKGGKVVTDWFFAQNRHDRSFVLSDVRLRSDVSDHCALSATVEIEYGL